MAWTFFNVNIFNTNVFGFFNIHFVPFFTLIFLTHTLLHFLTRTFLNTNICSPTKRYTLFQLKFNCTNFDMRRYIPGFRSGSNLIVKFWQNNQLINERINLKFRVTKNAGRDAHAVPDKSAKELDISAYFC